ncbi:MAG: RecX family transcriptional regulator [Myxococcota bacterium]
MPRKTPKRVSPEYLRRVARWYIDRWFGSSASLRRTLMRRVYRAVAHHQQDREELTAWVDEVVAEFVANGLVNDLAFARETARRAFERGTSRRAIIAKLATKGIRAELREQVLEELQEELDESTDLVAAARYARRRGFGPFRRPDQREARADKDLAAMVRAGFSYSLARETLQAETRDELDERIMTSRGW